MTFRIGDRVKVVKVEPSAMPAQEQFIGRTGFVKANGFGSLVIVQFPNADGLAHEEGFWADAGEIEVAP